MGDRKWVEEAACKDADTGIFFPIRREDAVAAAVFCRQCPVIGECHAYAESNGSQTHGVWAGLWYDGLGNAIPLEQL